MAIVLPNPPAGGDELIQRHVPYLLAAGGITDVFDGADKPFRVARPQPLYASTAQDFVDRKALDRARHTGWQYVVLTDDAVFASAEISNGDETGGEMMFTVLRFQSFTRPIVKALQTAEELPEIDDGDYELRILRSSSVYLRAIWLHGPTDILIPMERTPRGISANIKYSEEQLTNALLPLASRRSKGNNVFDPATEIGV